MPKHGYTPLARNSIETGSVGLLATESSDFDLEDFNTPRDQPEGHFVTTSWISGHVRSAFDKAYAHRVAKPRSKRRIFKVLLAIASISFIITVVLAPFFSPYSKRPAHYSGSNKSNETVFIAANIINENLVRGSWGQSILELVDTIGPENTFLSIYENDSGPGMKEALQELAEKVPCKLNEIIRLFVTWLTEFKGEHSIVSGHVDTGTFPSIQVLPGEDRIKRIAYLSHVRNQALKPLDQAQSTASSDFNSTDRHFDKLLFLNDIVFSASDAADLLFSTNMGPDGHTDYHAACAMDFDMPFKFYDRFALRDAEFNRVGVPFFPWFTAAGEAESWNDVMSGTDAVRVQSCWGGMVAFEAKWFQSSVKEPEPLRFRYEEELFWDASECCLIHADLLDRAQETVEHASTSESGIYVNPHIRVAYDDLTFYWLDFFRRFERLFTLGTFLLDAIRGLPGSCERRLESPGEEVTHRTWMFDGPTDHDADFPPSYYEIADFGHWETVTREAKPGGYCGYDMLLAWKSNFTPGVDHVDTIHAPVDLYS